MEKAFGKVPNQHTDNLLSFQQSEDQASPLCEKTDFSETDSEFQKLYFFNLYFGALFLLSKIGINSTDF